MGGLNGPARQEPRPGPLCALCIRRHLGSDSLVLSGGLAQAVATRALALSLVGRITWQRFCSGAGQSDELLPIGSPPREPPNSAGCEAGGESCTGVGPHLATDLHSEGQRKGINSLKFGCVMTILERQPYAKSLCKLQVQRRGEEVELVAFFIGQHVVFICY